MCCNQFFGYTTNPVHPPPGAVSPSGYATYTTRCEPRPLGTPFFPYGHSTLGHPSRGYNRFVREQEKGEHWRQSRFLVTRRGVEREFLPLRGTMVKAATTTDLAPGMGRTATTICTMGSTETTRIQREMAKKFNSRIIMLNLPHDFSCVPLSFAPVKKNCAAV